MTGKSHRTIGYLRVSTGTQDLKKNRAEILAFANEKDLGRVEFVEETASGRTAWRDRKIATVLDGLGTDDILIVSELSRIGRSMLDCMEILAIAAKREIRVYAIKGNWDLDETIQSKIIAMEPFAKPSKISDFIPLNGYFCEFSLGTGHLPRGFCKRLYGILNGCRDLAGVDLRADEGRVRPNKGT